MVRARYDGIADWYDLEFQPNARGGFMHGAARRLLGPGAGSLLDVGCGTGVHTAGFAADGWSVTGVDISRDMLRRARQRGLEVLEADASALPFEPNSFDAVVSLFTHTDVDDFAAVAREVARVARPGAPFVYAGLLPCFCGPHTRYGGVDETPIFFAGYRRTGPYADAPGLKPEGLRAKVGATHLPLDTFLQAFLAAGFVLEAFEEGPEADYPYMVVTRWRR